MSRFSPEFIGYWGNTQPRQLDNLLKATIYQPHNTEPFWGIAYGDGVKVNPFGVSISASGLNDADVWVSCENNRLVLGRGIFGRVTLFWLKLNEVIWFASKLQLLLPLLTKPTVNLHAVYGYSCFSYIPVPLTPIDGIEAIAPGSELSWSAADNCNLKCFYEWQSPAQLVESESHATEKLQFLLKNAISTQLENLPREPVGVFLSGGLDSAVVAALLVQAGVKVNAYSLDFRPYGVSELAQAELVAKHLSIPLVKVKATPSAIKQALKKTVADLDLPFGDGVTVPLYLLCERASQEVEVVFNGENGDQLFAGWTNKPLIAASVYDQGKDFLQQYLHTFHRLYGYEKKVFSQEHIPFLPPPQEWLKNALDSGYTNSLLSRLRRANLMLKGAQNIQPRATNIAFGKGLMVRSPFCDLPLAEFTFNLKDDLFLRGSQEKYILKKAVLAWLPQEIVTLRKRGMGVPLTSWFLGPLWGLVREWLNPLSLKQGGLFNPDLPTEVILGRLGGHIQGRRIGETLWLLMIWQIWSSKQSKVNLNSFWMPYSLWKKSKNWQQNY